LEFSFNLSNYEPNFTQLSNLEISTQFTNVAYLVKLEVYVSLHLYIALVTA